MTDLCVDKSVAGPTCTKVIPIYPVRYAVMPSKTSEFLYDTKISKNLDASFPLLPETAYCLRNLRDEGYVYIYDPKARDKWSCYQYNPNGKPGFNKMRINKKDGTPEKITEKLTECIEHSIHEHQPDKIYMGYLDSPYTLAIMKKVESGELKSKIMQEINAAAWMSAQDTEWKANKVFLKKAPASVKHGFITMNLLHWNKDYDDNIKMQWSENPADFKISSSNIDSAMYRMRSLGGMAVALYDAVGIASELSQLVNYEVVKIKSNSEETARKEWVSSVIDKLTANAGEKAFQDETGNWTDQEKVKLALESSRGSSINNNRGARSAMDRITQAQYAAKNNATSNYNEANRLKERLEFKKALPDIRKKIHDQIQAAGEPHYQWIQYTGLGSFTNALQAYDVNDVFGFQAYQGAVARSVDGLLATTKGTEYLSKQLPASGPTGIMKIALLGHPDIAKHLNACKTTDTTQTPAVDSISTSSEKTKPLDPIDERTGIMNSANAAVDGKLKLLAELSIQPTHASRHLSLIVTTVLIQENRYGTMAKLIRSVYILLLEVAEGNAVNKVSMSVNHVTSLMYKATTGIESAHPFKPVATYTKKTDLFYLNQSDNPFNQVDMAPSPVQKATKNKLNFWHNAKIGLSGLGTAFAAFNIASAIRDFNDKDKDALTTSLSLAGSLFVGAASTLTVGQVAYAKRSDLTKAKKVSEAAKASSDAFERYALSFAIAASITAAVNNLVKAIKSNSSTSQTLYITAMSTHLSAGTLAFYQLMAKSENAMMKKGAKYISKKAAIRFGAARAAYLLGPGVAIALIAIEAIAFLLESLAAYFEKKKEIYWIEQSIWGVKPNKQWTTDKEKYELHKLFKKPKASMKPTIDTDITPTSNREDVEVVLPGFVPQVSHVEIRKSGELLGKDITTDQWGNKLEPIIKDKNGTRTITYKNIRYFGVVSVQYWPNKFADPEMYYKTDTNWSLFGPSTDDMNDIHRMRLKNPEYRKRLKARQLPNKN